MRRYDVTSDTDAVLDSDVLILTAIGATVCQDSEYEDSCLMGHDVVCNG